MSNGCILGKFTHESTDTDNGCISDKFSTESTVGLSRLQRAILAYLTEHQGRGSKGKPKTLVDAYYWELLHFVVGLPLAEPTALRWNVPDPTERSPGTHRFDPEQIGRARYRSAVSALSRAVGRLEHRGLVTIYQGAVSHWTGCSLREVPDET